MECKLCRGFSKGRKVAVGGAVGFPEVLVFIGMKGTWEAEQEVSW